MSVLIKTSMDPVSDRSEKILSKLKTKNYVYTELDDPSIHQLVERKFIRYEYVYDEARDLYVENNAEPFSITEDGLAYLADLSKGTFRFWLGSVIIPIIVAFLTALITTLSTLAVKM